MPKSSRPLTPWEHITPAWSRQNLIEGAGNRLKRIMYFPDVGAVPDDVFIRHCREADQRLDALRLADPDDAGVVYAGLSFTAVATGPSAEERARTEYYLCHELIEYMERRGGWYPDHPALDPAWRGLFPEEEAGPAPQTRLESAIIARAAESAAGMRAARDEAAGHETGDEEGPVPKNGDRGTCAACGNEIEFIDPRDGMPGVWRHVQMPADHDAQCAGPA